MRKHRTTRTAERLAEEEHHIRQQSPEVAARLDAVSWTREVKGDSRTRFVALALAADYFERPGAEPLTVDQLVRLTRLDPETVQDQLRKIRDQGFIDEARRRKD